MMPVSELSIAVVGARFPNRRRGWRAAGDRQIEILLCKRGEPVQLEREPENEFDPNAIAVYSDRGVQIGYISVDRASIVHRAISGAMPVRALFQEATSWGCAIRISFDGNEPWLPPAHTAEYGLEPSDEFSPDPEPSNDGGNCRPDE